MSRIEVDGHICVVSGDYKLEHDSTCPSFDPLATRSYGIDFRLADLSMAPAIRSVCRIGGGRTMPSESVPACCSSTRSARRSACSPASTRASGDSLLHMGIMKPAFATTTAHVCRTNRCWRARLVLARRSAQSTRRFSRVFGRIHFGWMQLRGARRRRSVDLRCREATPTGRACSERLSRVAPSAILVTHGYVAPMVRWLSDGYRDRRLRHALRAASRTKAKPAEKVRKPRHALTMQRFGRTVCRDRRHHFSLPPSSTR